MIGVYGGCFDPVHFGHLRIALEITDALSLSQLLFIPSASPPHRDQPVADWEQRLAMLTCAIKAVPAFKIDSREYARQGPSYMVDTLTSLRTEKPSAVFCLILGYDAFAQLNQWHEWQTLFELAHIVIASRPGVNQTLDPLLDKEYQNRLVDDYKLLEKTPAGYMINCTVTGLDIASSQIRHLLQSEKSIRFLTPDPVIAYIQNHHLYITNSK